MASFSQAQAVVKGFEGGYSDDSRDAGNWTGGKVGQGSLIGTNWGISAPTLSAYLGRTATKADMNGLSYQTAVKIYRANYWDALSLSDVDSDSIATLIYDGAVNQGPGAMKKEIADSLNTLGLKANSRDSISSLIKKVNNAPQERFFNELKRQRGARYDKGSYAYNSWMNRLKQIEYFARHNWKGIVIGSVVLIGLVALLVSNRTQIIKSIN